MTQENSDSQSYANVSAQEVLGTQKTGKPPENVNTVPDDPSASSNVDAQPGSHESGSGSESSSPGGSSEVTTQEVLGTESTGKPPENVNNVPD